VPEFVVRAMAPVEEPGPDAGPEPEIGDGVGGLLPCGVTPCAVVAPGEAVLDVEFAPALVEESDVKETPDWRISSRRMRISDVFRARLNEMSHGMRRCSRPLR
jgi:hypothetical protein